MLNPETIELAKKVQQGLQQFEKLHIPVHSSDSNGNPIILCQECSVDFPCDRMLLFMVLQGLASLNAMLPTGNVANALQRFNQR